MAPGSAPLEGFALGLWHELGIFINFLHILKHLKMVDKIILKKFTQIKEIHVISKFNFEKPSSARAVGIRVLVL